MHSEQVASQVLLQLHSGSDATAVSFGCSPRALEQGPESLAGAQQSAGQD
jgi:hypothetical protein